MELSFWNSHIGRAVARSRECAPGVRVLAHASARRAGSEHQHERS
ncbi:hypothetical protein HNQ79_003414 [Streptomyces candidus]|uniref:Uncharacterized protein n=1 Tax=Streptomyces candidus TaxID=67283 RepID=A0A7X0HIF6_9ACTN|nr:hypothetical protein [Streptomyces candidus]